MRLWSIHPQYLDAKGLVALWREALLAQHVLLGKTVGYKHHPQLERFKIQKHPAEALGFYLMEVYLESIRRGYAFNQARIVLLPQQSCLKIPVTQKQIEFEIVHLKSKLKQRDLANWKKMRGLKRIRLHPLFRSIPGGIASWERVEK